MKPMIYKSKPEFDVLDEGICDGYHYIIVSYGTHPCAYVEIPESHKYYGCEYINFPDINCHGGLTYSSKGFVREIEESGEIFTRDGYYIGWDYNHYGDYSVSMALFGMLGEKRWTTEEIFKEVVSVIKQLRERENNV